jgi:hypothetical protein
MSAQIKTDLFIHNKEVVVENLRAWGGQDRFPDKLLRPDEGAKACGLTSTFQTAGCGPARPVVWEGYGGKLAAAPIPIYSNSPGAKGPMPGAPFTALYRDFLLYERREGSATISYRVNVPGVRNIGVRE